MAKKNYYPSSSSISLYDDFLSQSTTDRLQKLLARYELFKISLEVPGHLVECGVYKGSGVYTWAKLLQIFKPNNNQKVIGFDFFEKSRKMSSKHSFDKKLILDHAVGWINRDEIFKNLAKLEISNVELVAGNVIATTKEFVKKNRGLRISLLHLDVDTYEATLACLKNLYPQVSPGGVVIFDEYGIAGCGESEAVDEYFKKEKIELKSLSWANTPTAYLIKDAH